MTKSHSKLPPMKTPEQILHEHSPNKNVSYEGSWIIDAMKAYNKQCVETFVDRLSMAWSFNVNQQHTHTWHDRQNFIENMLRIMEHGEE